MSVTKSNHVHVLWVMTGEHIDYCGYAVLPMAIEQDVVFAASLNIDNEIILTNTNPAYKYVLYCGQG